MCNYKARYRSQKKRIEKGNEELTTPPKVRRAWKDKRPQRKRSEKIYSFKSRENPKRPQDEQQNIYTKEICTKCGRDKSHFILSQPWEKNVINAAESLGVLVHSVIQETPRRQIEASKSCWFA